MYLNQSPGRLTEVPECAGCAQERWLNDPNADLSAAQPSVEYHVCNERGPKTDKDILAAIKLIAKEDICRKDTFPGTAESGWYELAGLLWRLAGKRIENTSGSKDKRRAFRQPFRWPKKHKLRTSVD